MVIAIDGKSSTGKSTLAKELATKLQFLYIDSGAMYRAVTYYLLEDGVELTTQKVCPALSHIQLEFRWNGESLQNEIWLNGSNVERGIRNLIVADNVSEVAAMPCVRDFLVEQQRNYAESNNVVMDGRDIGTVIFPEAEVKLFVTADFDTRVARRYHELLSRGDKITQEQVAQNLKKRDEIDSSRKVAPLRQAEDALVIDNTNLTKEEQLDKALQIVKSAS